MNATDEIQPMDPMVYESFLRWAFSLPSGKHLEREGDPAKAATTDAFATDNIATVKAATAYAMAIYWNTIVNSSSNIPESDYNQFRNFVANTISSITLQDILKQIADFNESFVKRYFEISDDEIRFVNPA